MLLPYHLSCGGTIVCFNQWRGLFEWQLVREVWIWDHGRFGVVSDEGWWVMAIHVLYKVPSHLFVFASVFLSHNSHKLGRPQLLLYVACKNLSKSAVPDAIIVFRTDPVFWLKRTFGLYHLFPWLHAWLAPLWPSAGKINWIPSEKIFIEVKKNWPGGLGQKYWPGVLWYSLKCAAKTRLWVERYEQLERGVERLERLSCGGELCFQ